MARDRLLLITLPLIALSSTRAAWADDDEELPPPPPMQAPMQAPMPVYPAPLSQTTQTTYVPQSVALSGPEEITDYDWTRPTPAGYTMVRRPRKGLIVGGAVTLGAVYSVCALTAAIGEDEASYSYDGSRETNPVAAMWIPVAGPFIQMARTDSATANVFLAGLGSAQLAGAIMLYYGMTTTKRVLVRNDLVGSLTVNPMVANGASGLSVAGRF